MARQRCDDVVVVGASMGAIAALAHAAENTTLAGVVTVSSPARWKLHGLPTVGAAVMTKTRLGVALLVVAGLMIFLGNHFTRQVARVRL